MPRRPFGGPWSHEWGHHEHGPRRRFFERGAIRFMLLELLSEGPMHGYEMIRRLEERSGGIYAPSPGVIYPTLQSLEDQGLVSFASEEGKKVYTLTDAGRAALAEWQQRRGHGPGERGRRAPEPDLRLHLLHTEVAEVMQLLSLGEHTVARAPEHLARFRAILSQARAELSDMLYGVAGTPNAE